MELWVWLWTEFNLRTGDARMVGRSHAPHFSAVSARDHLVERLRFAAETQPEYGKVADLVEATTTPLAAAMRNEVFCVAKVDQDSNPLPYGNFARKQDAALSYAIKNKRSPKIW
jgi:hypothetical protein